MPERVGLLWLPPASEENYTICQAEIVATGKDVEDWRLQPGVRVVVRRFGRAALNDTTWVIGEKDVLALVALSGELPTQDPQTSRARSRRALQTIEGT